MSLWQRATPPESLALEMSNLLLHFPGHICESLQMCTAIRINSMMLRRHVPEVDITIDQIDCKKVAIAIGILAVVENHAIGPVRGSRNSSIKAINYSLTISNTICFMLIP